MGPREKVFGKIGVWQRPRGQKWGGLRVGFPPRDGQPYSSARTTEGDRLRLIINDLAQAYWRPIYCYLVRKGYSSENAKDLTQDFFTEIVCDCTLVRRADPSKGRFRTFLLTALECNLVDDHRKRGRKKRLPSAGIVNLEAPDLGNLEACSSGLTPAQALDYAFVTDLLDQVLAEVEDYYCKAGKTGHWEVFRLRVLTPILEGCRPASLDDICAQLGIRRPAMASNMEVTVKRRFRAVLMRRLRDLTGSEDQAKDEFDEIWRFLSEEGAG